jgi:hypothetical protein
LDFDKQDFINMGSVLICSYIGALTFVNAFCEPRVTPHGVLHDLAARCVAAEGGIAEYLL